MLQCDRLYAKGRGLIGPNKYRDTFIVKNDKGLHTRPSTELVKCACSYKAEIHLICDDTVVNAKSILGILMLAASKGTLLTVEASGQDAKEAVEAILKLSERKFYMNY